jgi:hypothetical protein
VKKPERRQYLKNTYRVLLTRARQGIMIVVPPAAKHARLRDPAITNRELLTPFAAVTSSRVCC